MGTSAADIEKKLAAFRSRNKNSEYKVIRRRIVNEDNIFKKEIKL